MYSVLIALATGILGALIGLLAGASGPIVLARRANLEWLRGARAELCDKFYSLLVDAAENVKFWDQFEGMPADASYQELTDAAAALDLYCSAGLSRAAQSAARKYRRCLVWDMTDDASLDFTIERINKLGEEFLDEVDNVRKLIQAELLTDVVQAKDPIKA